jgi:hypothetical protein
MRLQNQINMIGWCLFVLFVSLVLFFANVTGRLNRLESPVTPSSVSVPDMESALISQGWVKECMRNETIERYRFVDEVNHNCDVQCRTFDGCLVLYPFDSDNCATESDCLAGCPLRDNESMIVPSRAEYYNESVCLRYIFVRWNNE